eukprot:jgi/Mesvir1/25631/Mv01851-RA.1
MGYSPSPDYELTKARQAMPVEQRQHDEESYGECEVPEPKDAMHQFAEDWLLPYVGSDAFTTTAVQALAASLVVSLVSLVCLALVPLLAALSGAKSVSELLVATLSAFGAGAMLGDAFLHQLPHAFAPGGHAHGHGHDHAHDHGRDHGHDHGKEGGHAHSIQDLSIGLTIIGGIVTFFLVEVFVRWASPGSHGHSHGHGHSHALAPVPTKEKSGADAGPGTPKGDKAGKGAAADSKARKSPADAKEKSSKDKAATGSTPSHACDTAGSAVAATEGVVSIKSLGYLNLLADAVHNFTDGMSLGAAFLSRGAVIGWSKTTFMIAHELPQEIGDFGLLVRAGFRMLEALFLNFLSALVAMAGCSLALYLGSEDPTGGNAKLIEAFTAGGFMYIALAGIMADMHTNKSSTFFQLLGLLGGVGVALYISINE